MLSDQKL